jgi:transposase InsO family protein
VARCTVERIMGAQRWRGVVRARTVRTTERDPAAARAPDLVKRRFHAARPNELDVADFTFSLPTAHVNAFTNGAIMTAIGTSKVTAALLALYESLRRTQA